MTKQQRPLESLYGKVPAIMKKSVFLGTSGLFLFVLGVCLLMWESECFRVNMKNLLGAAPTTPAGTVDVEMKCDNIQLDQMHMAGLVFITLAAVALFFATMTRINMVSK
jgi:hypothetical protein